MPLYLALAAVLLGVAVDVSGLGREWTFSYIDAVAVGVAAGGAALAWRRGKVRLDGAMLGYGGLLLVIAAQLFVRSDTGAIVGGASRFLTAALLLFGLTQLATVREEDWTALWRWPVAIAAFGSVLAVWVLVPFVRALGDPTLTDFYAVKNAVVTPLGASNYLAAFLLVSFLIVLVHAVEQDRRWYAPAVVVLVGLLATMSRGAIGAALLVLLGLAVSWRERHVVVRAVATVGVAGVALGLVAVAAAGLTSSSDRSAGSPEALASPSVRGGDRTTAEVAPPSEANVVDPEEDEGWLGQLDGAFTTVALGGRRQLYGASWQAFVDHPVLGVGVNQLDTYTGRGGHPPHVNAHNLLLHALATTGLLGAAAYLAVLAVLVSRLWRLPAGTARTALLAGLAALLLHAQVEALSHTRAVETLLVVLLVIAGSAPGAVGIHDRGGQPAEDQG